MAKTKEQQDEMSALVEFLKGMSIEEDIVDLEIDSSNSSDIPQSVQPVTAQPLTILIFYS